MWKRLQEQWLKETLERRAVVTELQYRYNMTDAMKALYAALAAAQAEIGTASKNKKNAFFQGSKYADLASVWEAWQEVGPKNGLAVIQLVKDAGERQGVILETILTHKDGGTISAVAFFPADKNSAQAYGSALTYARRYALSALVGVAPDDDDGNAASGKVAPAQDKTEFLSKLDKAYTANRDDLNKLMLLRKEADKVGHGVLVSTIDERMKELRSK